MMEYKKVGTKSIPKKLSVQLNELAVGEAIIIPAHRQAPAMSIIAYWERKGRLNGRVFKSQKRNADWVYIIREA